jgi:hypothetical protein
MKSTMSLRSLLYENIVNILDQLQDCLDEKYLSKLLGFLLIETASNLVSNTISIRKISNKGLMMSQNVRASNRNSALIEDYVTRNNFIEGLRDLSHIND